MKQSKPRAAGAGAVRIVGGRWRGRRLPVVDSPGLRPSGDRLRETLFNWLQGEVAGGHCLDLFAGSGALGMEALSRGAASAVLVDREAAVGAQLRRNLAQLGAPAGAEVAVADWRDYLAAAGGGWQLAFVDPPFASAQIEQVLAALAPLMAPAAWVYVESAAEQPPPALPPRWRLHRERATRGAIGRLLRVG